MFSKNSNPTLSTNYNQPIKLKNISKKYQLGNSQTIWAIKNVNLKINKGSRIGIFGPNGSGKTTLLRIISKITQPTSGQLSIKGKIISLMDLTAGFLPDLTGKENIFINAQLTGMTRKQVKNNYQKIVSLSESKKFINYPFYTYSAGMKFRLAFSIAAINPCDILIIDEILTAGDFSFQVKTAKIIKQLQEKTNATTIIASHIPLFIFSFAEQFYQMKFGKLTKKTPSQTRKIVVNETNQWDKQFDYPK